jgi:hypothetical protein
MISDHWTRGNTVRVVSKCLVAIALMPSVVAVGLEGAAHASPVVSEAAGFPVSAEVQGGTTLAIDPLKLGDLIIFESQLHSTSITVTGVNCPGTEAWTLAKRYVEVSSCAVVRAAKNWYDLQVAAVFWSPRAKQVGV